MEVREYLFLPDVDVQAVCITVMNIMTLLSLISEVTVCLNFVLKLQSSYRKMFVTQKRRLPVLVHA